MTNLQGDLHVGSAHQCGRWEERAGFAVTYVDPEELHHGEGSE